MHLCLCNTPEPAIVGGRALWPTKVVTYFEALELPGLRRDQVRVRFDRAAASINAVCGVSLLRTRDRATANIVAETRAIDGPWGVLAEAQLPHTATAQTQLLQWYDDREPWGPDRLEALQAVVCHELIHSLGVGHLPGTKALMEPAIVAGRYLPQPPDVAELVTRYGPPAHAAPPDWKALGRQLAPYLVGSLADGLHAAAAGVRQHGQAQTALDGALEQLRGVMAHCWDRLVVPQLGPLGPDQAATALKGLAKGLASAIERRARD